MKDSLKTGVSFGLTSATITTLGLIVGLASGTQSKVVVLGGIITIAVADAFSDALGIHIAEEAENQHTPREIWLSTLFTFLAKLFFALTFLIPVILLDIFTAVIFSIFWGLLALGIISYKLAKIQNKKPLKVIAEHIFIAVIVVILSDLLGDFVAKKFG